MAKFNTHLAVATVGSGLCATVALAGNVVPHNYILTLTLAGAIGGILPDIDLEKAIPSRMLFSGLGIILAFVALFAFDKQYSIAELWVVWLSVYLFVRYPLHHMAARWTYHRGIFHSLLAAGFFMVATAVIFDRIFGEPPVLSWFTGLFVFMGFIIHLVLDEIYSVDVEGNVIKKSFGTALKLIDTKSMKASVLMAVAFAAVLVFAPSIHDFYNDMRAPTLLTFFKGRLLPKDGWFIHHPQETTAVMETTPAIPPTPPPAQQ